MLYFFNMCFGDVFHDCQGTELSDVDAAFNTALLYACEVLRARPDLLRKIGEAKVEVLDAAGELVSGLVVSTLSVNTSASSEDVRLRADPHNP